MTGRHHFEPHTADLRLVCEGATAEEAAGAALAGLLEAVFGRVPALVPERWDDWRARADDEAVALVELLGEALFRIGARGEVVVAFTGSPRIGRIGMAPLPAGLEAEREVKAVTFNELVWRRSADGAWRAAVTLDL